MKHPSAPNLRDNILILSVSSGSGHTRAAEALEKSFQTHPSVGNVTHIDALAYTNKVFHRFYSDLYLKLIKDAPTLWGWFYEKTDEPWKTDRMRLMLDRMNMRPLVERIHAGAPRAVVCTHFLPAEIISYLISKGQIDTHLSIVVTDFYVHAMWLSRVFHHYFVAHDESKVHLKMLGFPEDNIVVSGIPIDPVFRFTKNKADLRKLYELDPDIPVILVSAGTFGVTGAGDIVRSLSYLMTPVQLVVVCGKNNELRRDVSKIVEMNVHSFPCCKIMGFTTAMHEWMALADLFVGKPGGLTTAEALASKLPMVIYNPIPGQEEHNSDYLLEQAAAVKCSELSVLAFKVDSLLNEPKRLDRMRRAAGQLAHPEAAQTIVRTILEQDVQVAPRGTS